MKDNKNNNDNFFNKNPLLLFIIFALLIIVLFRSIAPNAESSVNSLVSGKQPVMNLTYSDIKKLAKEKELTYVAIGKTYIKAKMKDGSIITVPKVPNDPTSVSYTHLTLPTIA
jgi:cell division protease FtsH